MRCFVVLGPLFLTSTSATWVRSCSRVHFFLSSNLLQRTETTYGSLTWASWLMSPPFTEPSALQYRLDPRVMQTLHSWIMAQRRLGIINLVGPYSRHCHDTVSLSVWIYYTLLMSATEYSKLAVHLWTNNLAKRLTAENSKVMVLLAHPGPILSVSFLHSTLHFFTDIPSLFSLRMVPSATWKRCLSHHFGYGS